MMRNMMRVLASALVLLAASLPAHSQEGYRITANIKPYRSGYLFLAYHYGKRQFLIDSAKIDEKGDAVFTGKEALPGGVYLIAFPRKDGWVECVLDRQQHFRMEADSADLIRSMRFTGSSDNDLFAQYQLASYRSGMAMSGLQQRLASAPADSAERIRALMQEKGRELQRFREDFMAGHPEHILASLFQVLRDPVVPEASRHPGGRYDSLYAYRYYKDHFWEGVRLDDDRLVRTPVFQPKLERYFNDLVSPHPDSLIREVDEMLFTARNSPEMFKFLLQTFTELYVNPKYMGQDAVFVHLFEKYFLAGRADAWMTEKYRKFVFDRGYSLMANVIGKKGADFEFLDTAGRKSSLYALKGSNLVICFWDPTCGHCQEEVPRLDTLYRTKWKARGVTLLGVMTDGGMEKWREFIRKYDLKGWVHGYQSQQMRDADMTANRPNMRQLYDVYQTPMLYLLDTDKRIVAKKLTYTQLDELLVQRFAGSPSK